jgi:hypothetical protein
MPPLSRRAIFSESDRFHVQGMAKYELNPVVFTEVGDPVPGEHAFDTDDQVILVIGDQFQ